MNEMTYTTDNKSCHLTGVDLKEIRSYYSCSKRMRSINKHQRKLMSHIIIIKWNILKCTIFKSNHLSALLIKLYYI